MLAIGGCKRKESPTPSASSSAKPPADHLAKGEVAEGSERAFTLPLPLHSTIKMRSATTIHVATTYTPEELIKFVQTRVKDGKMSTMHDETDFDRVVVTKDASKLLTIQIRPAAITEEYKSQLVVNDVTLPPEEPGTTDADRWRKAGMTPDGKLIDRKQLQ